MKANSLLSNALDVSSAFLNLQADGRVYFTDVVKGLGAALSGSKGDLVTGDALAGDKHTFLVDVRSIVQNSSVLLSLDFLGNGAGDGQVIVSDVGIVVVEAPVAVAD